MADYGISTDVDILKNKPALFHSRVPVKSAGTINIPAGCTYSAVFGCVTRNADRWDYRDNYNITAVSGNSITIAKVSSPLFMVLSYIDFWRII